MVELGSMVIIVSSNEESDTERSRHDSLLTLSTLTESESQITHCLGDGLNVYGLIVVKIMLDGLHSCVVNHGSGICSKTGHGTANVFVDFDDLLDGRCLEQGRGDSLLNTENDTILGGNTNGCGSELLLVCYRWDGLILLDGHTSDVVRTRWQHREGQMTGITGLV